jgi:ADP-ribosylglycohydrolase
MRVAPLAFLLDPENSKQRTVLRDISRITHHNDEAYIGAVAIVSAVRAVAAEKWRPGDNLPLLVAESLPHTMVRERLLAIGSLNLDTSVWKVGRQFGCSGFVAESVPLALYAAGLIGRVGFRAALREAIVAGGDTDTIASMTGQIAGSWAGLSGIPPELVQLLPNREEILRLAHAFASVVATTIRGDRLMSEDE